jgi:hypothetical protein
MRIVNTLQKSIKNPWTVGSVVVGTALAASQWILPRIFNSQQNIDGKPPKETVECTQTDQIKDQTILQLEKFRQARLTQSAEGIKLTIPLGQDKKTVAVVIGNNTNYDIGNISTPTDSTKFLQITLDALNPKKDVYTKTLNIDNNQLQLPPQTTLAQSTVHIVDTSQKIPNGNLNPITLFTLQCKQLQNS